MTVGTSGFRIPNAWWVVRRLLFACAFGLIAYLVVRIVEAFATGDLAACIEGVTPAQFGVAALVYLLSHLFRILRLALLVGGWRTGFRDIASFHLTTAGVSFVAPLKLGEVYRAIEMASIAGGFVRGVAIVWCERTLDVMVLVVLLLIGFFEPNGAADGTGIVAGVSCLFIAITAVLYFIVPDNLRRLAVLIIRRYNHPQTIPVLRVVAGLRRAILETPYLVRGKVASLATLTAFIWAAELACFAIAIPALRNNFHGAIDELLSFLSEVTRGTTVLHVLAGNPADLENINPAHMVVAQVPLAFLSLGAAVLYARRRMNQ